jgi:import inner membrane translocase subunit TIM50
MLPRAAFRALRTRPALAAPRITPIASTSQWKRTYAKVGKPKEPTVVKDNSWKPTDPIKFDEVNKARPNPVNPSAQPEFDSAAAPERNTTPTQPSRPAQSATRAAQDAGKNFNMGEQEEMAGPKAPSENSDPTSESPESQQPQKPLPDLRYGIPSTFAEEHAGAEGKAKRDPNDPNELHEDPTPGAAGGREGGGGGELPRSAYETSTDRRRNRVANWSYLGIGRARTRKPHTLTPPTAGVPDRYTPARLRASTDKRHTTPSPPSRSCCQTRTRFLEARQSSHSSLVWRTCYCTRNGARNTATG